MAWSQQYIQGRRGLANSGLGQHIWVQVPSPGGPQSGFRAKDSPPRPGEIEQESLPRNMQVDDVLTKLRSVCGVREKDRPA